MSLKNEIVGNCDKCHGSGWLEGTACSCLLKFRIYNRLLSSGFSEILVNFVNESSYQIPQIDKGEEFVNFFLNNADFVEGKGLSLFIYSQDRGRGKTTLAHKILFEAVSKFVDKEHYSSQRSYSFQHVEDLLQSFRDGKSEYWKSTWYVLDDLGNEDRATQWKKGLLLSSLQRVFHYRRNNRLPTIITSNYKPGDLSNIYAGELDSLLEIHPGGDQGGALYRSVEVGGGEDLRMVSENSVWPI